MSQTVNKIDTKAVTTDPFVLEALTASNITLHILRLDRIHPVISGNKIFKLKYYLEEAKRNNCDTVATFGGIYSNHIAATAYAAAIHGFRSVGYIKSSSPEILTPTLQEAQQHNMRLVFCTNEEYNEKKRSNAINNGVYCIPEGGYGTLGAKGASEILSLAERSDFSHVICAAGTGTMAAGIIDSANPSQKIVVISALKNAYSLQEEISSLCVTEHSFDLLHDYHFGGFAKHPPALLEFMREIWTSNALPTDIVYTSKTLFAVLDLARKNYFPRGSKLLMIHSGGLQGNRSLPQNSLPFL